MKILITGSTGFIGSFIVEQALEKGMEVWASVRSSSSRSYLQDSRIRFIELDLGNPGNLERQLAEHKASHGPWDYVVHAAGVTKCADKADFSRINTEGTRILANLLRRFGLVTRRFVYLSSLSVFGPVRENRTEPHSCPWWKAASTGAPLTESIYTPITEQDVPHPDTAYGKSKLDAENYLRSLNGFPVVILRPTGVYGPREKDYFLMAKSIKSHIDFAVGYRPQEITFVYVKDLVQAVFLALEKGRDGRCYFVSDGQTYSSRAFSDLLQAALGTRCVLHVKAPLWLLNVLCTVLGAAGRLTRCAVTLNKDKYNIMKQRNWQCDIRPICEELGYRPRYDLNRGVTEAVAWYKKEKWI